MELYYENRAYQVEKDVSMDLLFQYVKYRVLHVFCMVVNVRRINHLLISGDF